ncbi:MAG: carbohydrate ABC transporter permease [Clostridia bacterium]
MSIVKADRNFAVTLGKKKRKLGLLLFELGMIALTILYMAPLYFMVITAFKTNRELIFTPLALPNSFLHVENFVDAWNADLGNAYKNTFMIATVAVLLRIVFSSMAAFTLAKRTSKFHTALYVLFLIGIMIPLYSMLVPLVQLIKNLGLMNSRLGLIMVYIGMGMPFSIFMLTGFTRSIPNELIEAATIDGCGVYRLFWVIIFPLLKTALATLFLLDFLAIWNDFLLPMLTISSTEQRTITLAMYNFYGEFGSQMGLAFAGYTIGILPVILLFVVLQKYIVSGIMVGAVKG